MFRLSSDLKYLEAAEMERYESRISNELFPGRMIRLKCPTRPTPYDTFRANPRGRRSGWFMLDPALSVR